MLPWILNLLMTGKGPPPNGESFTSLSMHGVSGVPYEFFAKQSSTVESFSSFYYLKFVAEIGM